MTDNYLIRFLIASVLYFDLPMRSARAEPASTNSITGAGQAETARLRLERYLGREDVRAGLEQNGARPAATKAHIDALSDEVVAAIAGKIDAPAAGTELIGALVFLFDLLLLTDLLGLTKVYSFTRSVTK